VQIYAVFGSNFDANAQASIWLGLQMDFDLDVAEDVLALRIKKEVRQLDVA
jgi:hypothetical protein